MVLIVAAPLVIPLMEYRAQNMMENGDDDDDGQA
jgi:hypothetical protein